MDFVVGVHGLVRWAIVLVGIVAIVRYALVMAGRAQTSGMDRGLISAYTGLMDLNVLLGIVIIVGRSIAVGQVLPAWIEHAVTNIIAVIVAHVFAQRAKKIDDPRLKARSHLLGVVVSLLIIIVGVSFVGGWAR